MPKELATIMLFKSFKLNQKSKRDLEEAEQLRRVALEERSAKDDRV